ncbi:SH3 domain-containing protein [Desulfovulcanus sp.]
MLTGFKIDENQQSERGLSLFTQKSMERKGFPCKLVSDTKKMNIKNQLRFQLTSMVPLKFLIIALMFCLTQNVQASNIFLVEVKANSLNIRQSPTTKSKVIGSVKRGDQLVASTTSTPGWLLVHTKENMPGYISEDYIKLIKKIPTNDNENNCDQNKTKAKSNTHTFLVEVKANSLNIRLLPTTKSKVIGSVKKGDQLVASTTSTPGWLLVHTKENMPGYISEDYIELIKKIPTSDNKNKYGQNNTKEKSNANTPILSLSIDDVDFDCEETFLGDDNEYGFDSCDVNVSVSISSNCDKDLYVTVDCEAEFIYKTRNGFFEQTDSENKSKSIYVNNGHGSSTIKINWSPFDITDPVTSVQLKDCICRIISN